MNIQKYKNNKGETRYKFRAYIGIDPITGKEKRVQKSGFRTLADAKTAYIRLSSNKEQAFKTEYTFKEVYDMWYKLYITTVKESTALSADYHYRLYILPAIGHLKINTIKPALIQNIVLEWSATKNGFKVTFEKMSRIFNYAVKMELIEKNPCNHIILPKVISNQANDKKQKFLDKQQLELFLSLSKTRLKYKWYALFRLLSFSGMRVGEALALEWSDIDFKANQISITKTVSRKFNAALDVDTTKTKGSMRTIDMDNTTMQILKVLRIKDGSINPLVFHNNKGTYITNCTVRCSLYRILDENDTLPLISIHSLRHTHCSLLFESGASIKEVQDRLGHSNIRTTMDIYAHVSKNKKFLNCNCKLDFFINP